MNTDLRHDLTSIFRCTRMRTCRYYTWKTFTLVLKTDFEYLEMPQWTATSTWKKSKLVSYSISKKIPAAVFASRRRSAVVCRGTLANCVGHNRSRHATPPPQRCPCLCTSWTQTAACRRKTTWKLILSILRNGNNFLIRNLSCRESWTGPKQNQWSLLPPLNVWYDGAFLSDKYTKSKYTAFLLLPLRWTSIVLSV